jgi:mono/diheme cytochrome c family protein
LVVSQPLYVRVDEDSQQFDGARGTLRAIVVNHWKAGGDSVAASNIYKFMNNGVGRLRSRAHTPLIFIAIICAGTVLWLAPASPAQSSSFRNAPQSAAEMKNPYKGASAVAAGKKLYVQDCAQCHGANLQGMGPAPALDSAAVKTAKPGEVFWFITKGKLESGMPSWANLSEQQRWQIVTFVESQGNMKAAAK